MKSKKIMFVIPTLGTGGAERVATILANNLSKIYDIEFFVIENSNVKRYPINKCVGIKEAGIKVKRGNKFRSIINYIFTFHKQRLALKNEIKRFSPDIIISFLPKADMLVYSIKKSKMSWISSERNDPMSRSQVERFLLNHIYKRTSVLVCQTKKICEYYLKTGVTRVCVIRNPLILSICQNNTVDFEEKFIVSVGRLDKQKNYELLIKAFTRAKLNAKFQEKLYILGDGPHRQKLKKMIYDLNMSDEVILLGRKSNVNEYLKNATAFVMSSDYEGLPNALIEAMAMGLPVISTDFYTGAASELIDEKNGLLVPVGDIEKMEKAIVEIMKKPKPILKAMGRVSKKRVIGLDVDSIIKEWARLIRKTN
ncbi:glycosyltransferase [Enterococcus faecium]|nr:glycosyltransferase [Enterococcus faecium]